MHLSSPSIESSPAQALQPESAASAKGASRPAGAAGNADEGDDFAAQLAQAQGKLPRGQNIAAGAPPLTRVALSPALEVLTVGAEQPDGESLAAFATAQGIAPEVVAWLFSGGGKPDEQSEDLTLTAGTLDPALQANVLLAPGLLIPIQNPQALATDAALQSGAGVGAGAADGGIDLALGSAASQGASWLGQWVSGLAGEAGSAQSAESAQMTVPDAAGSFAAAQALASAGLLAKAQSKAAAEASTFEAAFKSASMTVEILSLEVDPFELSLLETANAGETLGSDMAEGTGAGAGHPGLTAVGAGAAGTGMASGADPSGEAPQLSSAQQRAEALHALAQRLGEAVGQRVLGQIARGTWSMKLMLKPATLGDVEVDLRMRSGELDAVFRSMNPMTRELLTDGLPRLREVLSGAGMDIAGLQVGQGSSQSAGGNPTPQQSLAGGRREEMGVNALPGAEALATSAAARVRRADSANWDVLV